LRSGRAKGDDPRPPSVAGDTNKATDFMTRGQSASRRLWAERES